MTLAQSKIIEFSHYQSNNEAEIQTDLVEQLLAIGTALSSSGDLGELLNLILSKSREITNSDAGSVYLLDNSEGLSRLVFKAAQNDSLPKLSFKEFSMPLTPKSLAGYVALTGKSLNLADAYYLPAGVTYQLDRSFDVAGPYRTRSVLVLPMQDQEGNIIGVLQLINRKMKKDIILTPENTLQFTKGYAINEEKIVRSLASQAAISIERNNLQTSIENLFEGFVKASVQLIEMRDPTTSGHSERVAELTVRLAQETNTIDSGALKLFTFDEKQIQEIRYAALLHDFGKVIVPESILGKQKKLYPDQLEVIRQRFNVAKKSVQLECAEHKYQYLIVHPSHQHQDSDISCEHCQKIQELESTLEKTLHKLELYWELILEANEPEVLDTKPFQVFGDEDLVELTELLQYTYIDADGERKNLITADEMAQLMIPRGNLTSDERKWIEGHVTHTYDFLKRIPWTKSLQDLPMIAYAHHEKLDGTGYPQKLRQDHIPIQSQMLTIADIYDALTASDRPYKRRLPTDTVMKILKGDASKNKINLDLVELFEQRQVFQVLGHSLELSDIAA
jgi:HD-GYP domain-containing protein (c-di-GMP phosphodiesterase class II)